MDKLDKKYLEDFKKNILIIFKWQGFFKEIGYGFFITLIFLVLKSVIEPLLLSFYVNNKVSNIFQPQSLFECSFVLMTTFYLGYYWKSRVFEKQKYPNKWYWSLFFIWLLVRSTNLFESWFFWEISYTPFLVVDLFFVVFIIILCSPIFYILSKSKEEIVHDYGYFIPDLPLGELVRITSDSKLSDFDSLKRSKFAKQLTKELLKFKPHNSFAIGINGSWGSGKTSLWHLIKSELEEKNNSSQVGINIIEFSPWFFNDFTTLVSNFFLLFEKDNHKYENEIRKYSKLLSGIEKSFISTELIDSIFTDESNIHLRYKELCDSMRNDNHLNIIFIDDLDRMDKDEIFMTLKLVKKLADFPNTVYILAYDREYIDSAIGQIITSHDSSKYLDKIVQMEFKIPEPNPDDLKQSLRKFIEMQFNKLQLNGIDIERLNLFYETDMLKFFIKNERDVKRFSNSAVMRYDSIHPDVDVYQFFLLDLLCYKYPIVYRAIYENKDALISCFNTANGQINEDNDLFRALKIEHSGVDVDLRGFINKIFKSQSKVPIIEHVHFHKYFSLSLFTGVDNVEFNQLFSLEPQKIESRLREWSANFPNELLSKLQSTFETADIKYSTAFTKITDSLFFLRDTMFNNNKVKAELLVSPEIKTPEYVPPYEYIYSDVNHDSVSRIINKIIKNSTVDEIYKSQVMKKNIQKQRDEFFFFNMNTSMVASTDHYFHEIYNLSSHVVKITIQPDKLTDFWRFGFKFSKTSEIPQIERESVGFPMIELLAGDLDLKQKKFINAKNLYINVYNLPDHKNDHRGYSKLYHKQEINIEISRISDSKIQMIFSSKNLFNNKEEFELPKEYNFFKILAWADFYNFRLNSIIKVEQLTLNNYETY